MVTFTATMTTPAPAAPPPVPPAAPAGATSLSPAKVLASSDWNISLSTAVYKKAMLDLVKIRDKFRKSKKDDDLSKRLDRIINRFIATPIKKFRDSPAEIEKFLNKFQRILSNPLSPDIPLQAPVLFGSNRVWDEWSITEFYAVTGGHVCPYDNKPIVEMPKPHLLGRECIEWLNVFKKHIPLYSTRYSLLSSDVKPSFEFYVTVLVKPYFRNQQLCEMIHSTKEKTKQQVEFAALAEEEVEAEDKHHKELLAALGDVFENGLSAQQASHDIDIARMKAKQKELDDKQTKLEEQQVKMLAHIVEQSKELVRLSTENERRRQEIAAAREACDDDSSCIIS